MDNLSIFAQEVTAAEETSLGFSFIIILLAIWLASIIAYWRVYQKAGQPGWASIIPIYNIYILLKIVGRPGWWLILYLIPFVNIIIHLVVAIDAAKAFGKDTAFGVIGLWLFSLIGYMILGFGDARYQGVASTDKTQPQQ